MTEPIHVNGIPGGGKYSTVLRSISERGVVVDRPKEFGISFDEQMRRVKEGYYDRPPLDHSSDQKNEGNTQNS